MTRTSGGTGTDNARRAGGERFAALILRRLLLGLRSAAVPAARVRAAPGRSWNLVVSRFRRLRKSRAARLLFGGPTDPSFLLAHHEHRLLRALAAVQDGAVNLVDFYLKKITRNPEMLALLTPAITTLAKELEGRGYHLPQLGQPQPIAAAALPVLRAHGHDMRQALIAWPEPSAKTVLG